MAFALNSRRITLIVAVTVALAAGLLTIRYLSTAPHPAEDVATVATRPVVIANRTIRAHEKILPEMLTRVTRPVAQSEPGTFAEPRQAMGNIALIEIPEGASVTEAKVGVPAAVGVTGKLRPGLRAISIPVDFIKSVSSLVSPGDRVDVLASNTRGKPHPTRTIIRGALVLAVNTNLDPVPQASPGTAASAPVAVTLAVTPEQANLLTFADNSTLLRLALRSPTEPIRSYPVQDLDVGDDSGSGGGAARPASRQEPSVYIVPPASATSSGGNVPPPAAPATAPGQTTGAPAGADVSAARKPILVIEGDQIVAGQR